MPRFETAQDVSIARQNYLKKTGIGGPLYTPFTATLARQEQPPGTDPDRFTMSGFHIRKAKALSVFESNCLAFYPRKKMNMEPENQPLIGKQAKNMLQNLQTSRKFGLQNVIRQPSRLNVLLQSPPPAYASGCHFLGRQRSFWLCPKNSYGFLSKSRRQKISRNYQKQLKFIQ